MRVRRSSRTPRAGARRRASTWRRGPPCAPTSSRPRPGHSASAQRAKASTPAERRRVVWACGTMHGARWRQVTERWCWARHRIGVEEMVRKRATVPRRLAGSIVPRRGQEAHHTRTPQPAQPLQLVQRRRELALRVERRGLWGRLLPREGRRHRASPEAVERSGQHGSKMTSDFCAAQRRSEPKNAKRVAGRAVLALLRTASEDCGRFAPLPRAWAR